MYVLITHIKCSNHTTVLGGYADPRERTRDRLTSRHLNLVLVWEQAMAAPTPPGRLLRDSLRAACALRAAMLFGRVECYVSERGCVGVVRNSSMECSRSDAVDSIGPSRHWVPEYMMVPSCEEQYYKVVFVERYEISVEILLELHSEYDDVEHEAKRGR